MAFAIGGPLAIALWIMWDHWTRFGGHMETTMTILGAMTIAPILTIGIVTVLFYED